MSPEYISVISSISGVHDVSSVSSIQDAWCLMSPVFLISPVSLVLQYLQSISVVLATDYELSWEPNQTIFLGYVYIAAGK